MSTRGAPIRVHGARENNLRGIDVEIPRYSFTVLTGPSGSGKSSLAFDTLFAEGRRRYVESLSSQARQLFGELHRPDVDLVEGLSPAVAVNQHGGLYTPGLPHSVAHRYAVLRLALPLTARPAVLDTTS